MTTILPALINKWPDKAVFGNEHSFERKITETGLFSLQRWEAYRNRKYIDVIDKDGKVWYAIGFGHGGASGVWPSQDEIANTDLDIPLNKALDILHADLDIEYSPKVDRLIGANVTTDMFNALVHCAFNMGITRFAKTDMVYQLNQGKYIAACSAFSNYNKARNLKTKELEVVNGLVCRRQCEGAMYLTMRG